MQDFHGGLVSDRVKFAARRGTEATNDKISNGDSYGSPRRAFVIAAALVALLPAASLAAVTAAQKCEGGKNDTSGKYAACMAKAEKSLVSGGTIEKYDDAQIKCADKFAGSWSKLEGAGSCPTTGDVSSIQDFVAACVLSVADALGGGTLPPDVVTCNANLTTCDSDLVTCDGDLATCDGDLAACESSPGAVPLETGQTTCYNAAGTLLPCAGTGQDGEFQNGATRGFTNNGNGTITDNATGLMWEVLSDDGSLHDKDTTYNWTNAIATKVADVNAAMLGGHDDWRLPNVKELETLRDFGTVSPAVADAFDSGCMAACTPTGCSCTRSGNYWTSSTDLNATSTAWFVGFNGGGVTTTDPKSTAYFVRLVRGTSDAELCSVGELTACEGENASLESYVAGINADAAACEVALTACSSNCDVDIAPTLATGQTTAYGAGTDGNLEKGLARSFTDNGDGTITDNATGLMWEKKSDDGSIHDKGNGYTWSTGTGNMDGTIVTTFLATLNGGGGFAGHTDWRIPNLNELETIRNLEVAVPATYPEFNDSCTGGCTVTTCSCTQSYAYWSSSTHQYNPSLAWGANFNDGGTYADGKTDTYHVRAVRAGS